MEVQDQVRQAWAAAQKEIESKPLEWLELLQLHALMRILGSQKLALRQEYGALRIMPNGHALPQWEADPHPRQQLEFLNCQLDKVLNELYRRDQLTYKQRKEEMWSR